MELVHDKIYDVILQFDEDMAAVKLNKEWFLINKKGIPFNIENNNCKVKKISLTNKNK